MHIEYLYYFRDFSETMSISKAAAKNFMTPQGLSRALHQLENEFGIKLMSYQGNEISLTLAGEELNSQLGEFLRDFEDIKGSLLGYRLAELNRSGGEYGHVVRVAVTPCVSHYFSPMLDLQRPGLFEFEIKIKEYNIYRILPQLISRGDEEAMGIVSIPTMDKYREILDGICKKNSMVYEPLVVSPLVLMASAYSALAKKKSIKPSDVNGYSVARLQDTVLGDALDDFIREDNVKTATNSISTIYNRIIENHAISFAPKLIESASDLPHSVIVIPTKGFFDTEFGMITHTDAQDSSLIQEVAVYLRKKVVDESKSNRYGGAYEICSEE